MRTAGSKGLGLQAFRFQDSWRCTALGLVLAVPTTSCGSGKQTGLQDFGHSWLNTVFF